MYRYKCIDEHGIMSYRSVGDKLLGCSFSYIEPMRRRHTADEYRWYTQVLRKRLIDGSNDKTRIS